MSMMINPSGGGQIIAAGEPFRLRLKKKRPADDEPDATAARAADDGQDSDDTADEDD
jgi:hypothetical protein